jgi:hypothetical protein
MNRCDPCACMHACTHARMHLTKTQPWDTPTTNPQPRWRVKYDDGDEELINLEKKK